MRASLAAGAFASSRMPTAPISTRPDAVSTVSIETGNGPGDRRVCRRIMCKGAFTRAFFISREKAACPNGLNAASSGASRSRAAATFNQTASAVSGSQSQAGRRSAVCCKEKGSRASAILTCVAAVIPCAQFWRFTHNTTRAGRPEPRANEIRDAAFPVCNQYRFFPGQVYTRG